MALEVAGVVARLGFNVDEAPARRYSRLVGGARREVQAPVVARLGADVDQRAFDAYQRELAKAQATAKRRDAYIARLGADFDPRAFRAAERELREYEREAARAEAANARLSASNVNVSKTSATSAKVLGGLQLATAGLGVALQALGGAATGLVALTSAVAPLVGVMAAAPAAGTAAAQVFGTLTLATHGLSDALTAAQTASEGAHKAAFAAYRGGSEEAKAYREELEKLNEPQQAFVRALVKSMPILVAFRKSASVGLGDAATALENLISGGNSEKVPGLFKRINDAIRETSVVSGELAIEGAEMLRSWGPDLTRQMDANIDTIRRGGTTMFRLLDATRHVTLAARPLVDWMTRGAQATSLLVAQQAKAGRESGALERFFDQTRITMSRLGRITVDLAAAFINIGKAAFPVGSELLRIMTLNADKFADWTGSAKGQNDIKKYFEQAMPAILELGRLFVDLVKTLTRLGNSEHLAPLLKQVRTELLPALELAVSTITAVVGPGLINALTQITVLFSKLAAGPVAELTDVFASALGLLNDMITAVPELGTALSILLLLGGMAKLLGLVGAITGMKALIRLMGVAKGAAVALGTASASSSAAGIGAAGAAGAGGGAAGARQAARSGSNLGRAGAGATGGIVGRVLSSLATPGHTVKKPLYVWVVNMGPGGLARGGGVSATKAAATGAAGGAAGGGIIATAKALAGKVGGKIGIGGAAGAAISIPIAFIYLDADKNKLDKLTAQLDALIDAPRGSARFEELAKLETGLRKAVKEGDTKKMGEIADALRKIGETTPGKAGAGFTKLANDIDKAVGRSLKTTKKFQLELGRFHVSFPRMNMENVLNPTAVAALLSNFNRIRKGGVDSIEDLRKHMKFNILEISRGFKEGTSDWRDAMSSNIKVGIRALREGMRDGKISAEDGMKQIKRFVSDNMKLASGDMGKFSGEGRRKIATNFSSAADAVTAQMDRAGRRTKAGMELVRSYLVKELQVYGLSLRQAKNIVDTGDPDSNRGREGGAERVIERATGGIASPFGGSSGDDHILMDPKGRAVAKMSGTEGVVNAPQMGVINYAMGVAQQATGMPWGSLNELWGSGMRHYATGGMIGAANRLDKAAFPYLWGGGHGSSPAKFGPMDCSGAVSYVLQQGGVKIPTMVSGALANAGNPGPGQVTVFANAGHTFMRIGDRYFGTSGTNPGGGAGWFPDPGAGYKSRFTVRNFDGNIGGGGFATSVPTPTVKGGGAVGRAVNRVLAISAGSASKLLEAASMQGIGTGQAGDPGPGAEPGVISGFRRAIAQRRAQPKERLALWMAGIVESGLRNLPYGDRDSVGALQQRASQGWTGLMNPYAAALEFLAAAIAKRPWSGSAGSLAQAVQRSAFPGRYDAVAGQARAYMAKGGRLPKAKPVKGAVTNFDKFYKSLWGRAKSAMGVGFGAPRYRLGNPTKGAYAHWRPDLGRITVGPAMLKALKSPRSRDHDYALVSMLHEFAHAGQDFGGDHDEIEGGADAWAHIMAPRLYRNMGIPYKRAPFGYPQEAARIRQNKSRAWIMKGQFRGADEETGTAEPGGTGSTTPEAGVVYAAPPNQGSGSGNIEPAGNVATGRGSTDPYNSIRSLRRVQGDRIGDYDNVLGELEDDRKRYEQTDRRYGQTTEILHNDDGSLNREAIERRAGELAGLQRIRERIVRRMRELERIAKRVIRTYTTIIKRLRRSLKHAKKKHRKGILASIEHYKGARGEWRDKLKDLGFDITDAELDVGDIIKEGNELRGTVAEPQEGGGGGGDGGGGGGGENIVTNELTPDQQAQLDQVARLKEIVASGTFIDTTALGVNGQGGILSGVTNPNAVGQALTPGYSPALAAKAAAMGVDLNAPVGVGAAGGSGNTSGGGNTFIINTLHPGDPATLTAVASASNAGNSYLGTVSSPRADLGV